VLGGVFVALFLVAAQDGQFDDLDEDARRAVEEN
jgi:cbb3-type cytochrome oxidase maturation protein